MSSNLIEKILCPKCGKPLQIYHSRNDMKLFARCENCIGYQYELKSEYLELLFYRQYYKKLNHIDAVRWNDGHNK